MSEDPKIFALGVLRDEFIRFMEALAKIPGSIVQKQQAALRFDEGHMWMQNAVITFVEPKPVENNQSDKGADKPESIQVPSEPIDQLKE